MRPRAEIDACRDSHRRLLADLATLTDAAFREPSRLPGYTRAHVVAHLTNKARAHARLFGGPAAGEIRRLHPVGYDADRAAEAGAGRTAADLCADLAAALDLLDVAWDALDDTMWDRLGNMTAGPRTMAEIVGHHLRNVEVHHVDLDIGYRAADWPSIFVDRELAKRLATLPGRADPAELLAWLLDRAPAPNLAPW